MDYQVILSPRAIQDLKEIVRYISIDSPANAEKFGLALIEKARTLKVFPNEVAWSPNFGTTKSVRLSSILIASYIASLPAREQLRFLVSGMAPEELLQRFSVGGLDHRLFPRY